jgi:tetrahydromethanopterin S-methyltransferase subunit H
MFVFEREQYIYDIAGTKIGGNLGENPTVLIGTIFYSGHKIVEDVEKGIIDKNAAEALIAQQDEMSEITGNPSAVQVCFQSRQAAERLIDFISNRTEALIVLDSTEPDVRLTGLSYAEEVGLLDRVIYSSLNISVTQQEKATLKEIGQQCVIVLAFNPEDPSIAGRRKVLDEGAMTLDKGLLPLCNELGATKPLIDSATTAMGAGAGSAAAFTFVSKSVYGYPTGLGIHNAPSSWTWLRKLKKTNRDAFEMCDIGSNVVAQMLGADFILYGPIKNANRVFPLIAMTDILAAEAASIEFGIDTSDSHPFKKLL